MSPNPLARSIFAALLVSVIGVISASATTAQSERPVQKKNASPVSPGDAATAVNPDVIALRTSSDLIIKDLGFTAKGEVSFRLFNRGDVPINPGDPAVGRKQPDVPQNKQIKVDVYLQNSLLGSVYQARLSGKASRTFTVLVPPSQTLRCAQTRPLKTVIDPQLVIAELYDTNNTDTLTAARPCPDLAIQSIKKNWNDAHTEYVARIKLVNQGNAEAPRFSYMSQTQNNSAFSSLPGFDDKTGGPLAPGETTTFNMGSAFGYEKMWVRVWLDRLGSIEELDESNNLKEKVLD